VDAIQSVFGDVAQHARSTVVQLDDVSRAVLRFELNLMMAYDSLSAMDEELAYWAREAVTSARRVQVNVLPVLRGSLEAELARGAWDHWDAPEIERELSAWTTPGR
jgi:hypothetical protein